MAELPERLREAADAHRPDRERILARVEEAMAAPEGGAAASGARSGPGGPGGAPGRERPPAPWMRVAAVTAAVAAAVGLGGLAVGAVTGDASPAPTTAAPGGVSPTAPAPTSDSPRGSASSGSGASRTPAPPAGRTGAGTPHGTPTGHASGAPASGGPGPSATPTGTGTGTGRGDGQGAPQPGGATAQSNGLAATAALDGSSNDYWTQSDITLTADRPLTSLTIELRIARTPGVATTGSYDSVSGQTNVSTTVEGDVLVYRWALNAGQTLAPGTYTFAGQFQHDGGGRDASGDTYTVAASGPAGGSSLSGHY